MSKRKNPDPVQEAKKSIKRNSRRTVAEDSILNFKEILDNFNPSEVLKRNFQRTVMDVKGGDDGSAVAMDEVCQCQHPVSPNGPDFLSMNVNPMYPNAIDETILRHYGRHFFIGWNAC